MAVLLLALALDATAKTKPTGIIDGTPSALYEDALSRLDAGDVPAATIQLKNALQRDPNYLPARIALGQVYLRQGQAASTEKELRIALAMGAAADQVLPTLGNALLMQRKYEEILLTIRSKDPAFDGGFEVQLLRGRAHYQLGHLDEAESAFARARQAEANKPEPLVGLALVALARSDQPRDSLSHRTCARAPRSRSRSEG